MLIHAKLVKSTRGAMLIHIIQAINRERYVLTKKLLLLFVLELERE